MSKGSKIAAKVAKGIAKAGAAVGDGEFICTLKRPASGGGEPTTPWDAEDTAAGAPTLYEVTAIQNNQRVRDTSGTLIGESKRTLTISATGVTPLKSDLIVVGAAMIDVVNWFTFFFDGVAYEGISEVVTEAAGGVALFHSVTLEN